MTEPCLLCGKLVHNGELCWELVPSPNPKQDRGDYFHDECIQLALEFARIAINHLNTVKREVKL